MFGLKTCFHAVAIVALMPLSTSAQELYFSAASNTRIGPAPVVFGTRDRIEFMLTLRTQSAADRDRLPLLTIDDFRYDVQKRDGRVPNVRFDVMEMRQGTAYQPASYKVASERHLRLDGGSQTVDAWFLLGRSQPVYWMQDHFGMLAHVLEPHWEGTYRVRALYRDVASPPIFVTLR
jgi:hypothetical protein